VLFRSPLLIVAIAFVVSFFKIADLDFWWHLKSGQLILQQNSIPHTEIFSFTAFGREYIDHEWLFQVIQSLFYKAGGEAGIILLKSILIASIYLLITRFLLKKGISSFCILAVVLLSICGARTRFIERPELFTELFLVIIYIVIDSYLQTGKRTILIAVPICILAWSNIHAAVILGLALEVVFLCAVITGLVLEKYGYPRNYNAGISELKTLFILFLVSLLLTGANPNGYRILKVPFELTSIIDSGLLHNEEWKQPPLLQLPFFYLSLLFTFVLILFHSRRLHIASFLFSAFLGYISLKYVRNIGVFCMMMPLLTAPYLPVFESEKNILAGATMLFSICLLLLMIYSPFEFGIGHASYFPDGIVRFTKKENLQGHLLNSYGFGGYLIWNLYPERRIFIDGRNEVYLPLLKKLIQARGDSVSWKKLLSDYQIEYALLNYTDSLEEVTVLDQNNHRTKTYAPFTSTHFPRSAWALVYWDDDGMVLIRRKGLNASLVSGEYTSVFPEGDLYQTSLARGGKIDRNKAIFEIRRKLAEEPGCKRAQRLLQAMLSS